MDSSTTDSCEWCNRPMLPAGATVSAAATKEMNQKGRPLAAPPQPSLQLAHEAEAGLPLHQEEPEEAPVLAEPVAQAAASDVLLRPLGHGQSADPPPPVPAQPTQRHPTHGLADEATNTSIDISQYVGTDQSIFRPVQKDTGFSSASSLDRVTQKKQSSAQTGPGSNWSENDRLIRSAIAGLIVSVAVALLQFLVQHEVNSTLFTVIPLGSSTSLVTALKFGVLTGVAFGFMLGALLVKTQKGPGIGMLLGMMIGFSAVGSFSIYTELAGALSGIFVGRFATLGVRRAINV